MIVAPGFDPEAREAGTRKENVRLLTTGGLAASNTRLELRSVTGGLLVQGRDTGMVGPAELQVVTKRAATRRGTCGTCCSRGTCAST